MDNVKNDMYYSKKIRDNMAFLVKHTKGLSQKEIEHNEIRYWMCTFHNLILK